MRCIKGPLYIHTLLKRIELAKALFILEIESGKEVYVTGCLS